MKQIHKTLSLPDDCYIRRYFSETDAFFDIETTGFSRETAFVYLIGMAVRKENEIHIYQFLAENRTEEADILAAFHAKLRPVHTLITFNGLRFDIPFLKARETHHCIKGGWDLFECMDLYKLTGKFARLFHLPDKKQKSVEHFLGIGRDDALNGGELIPVYFSYEKQHNGQLEHLLLLHNYEDVLGMTKLLSLLSYKEFFDAGPEISEVALTGSGHTLSITLKAPTPFPKRAFYETALGKICCQESECRLTVFIFHGELKYFYDNYKDYYYLPDEDMAIHKSVAAFVDSAHKKKASANTCYTRRFGSFLPQSESLFSPCFYQNKKDKIAYFELQQDFMENKKAIQLYAKHLLTFLLQVPL